MSMAMGDSAAGSPERQIVAEFSRLRGLETVLVAEV